MESEPYRGGAPIQSVSLSITVLGVHARVDGRTGWEAWRALRCQHPRLAWIIGGYSVLPVLLAVLLALFLF
ncbi:hypothetical protein [Streptomyces sp. CC224B]|uniref:hypothetical protein n=1 Tax=Streptomyces sp. CC224B TaxID=3044571 RepID=UPI0024A9E3C4|nr:hypothetical protein [Streptomyces sp. CC224B]